MRIPNAVKRGVVILIKNEQDKGNYISNSRPITLLNKKINGFGQCGREKAGACGGRACRGGVYTAVSILYATT